MLKKIFAALPAAAAAGMLVLTAAAPASATTTPPLSVKVLGEAGGSAAWTDANTVRMSTGPAGAAYVDVQNVVGTSAPVSAPSFTESAGGAGSPRWVIEFHNGDYLFGYPAAGGSAAVDTWVCNPGGAPTTDYATALKACQPGFDDWVTAAFIVEDISSGANSTTTVAGIQYNGRIANANATVKLSYVCGGYTKTWSTTVSEVNGPLPATVTYYGYKGSVPTKLGTYILNPGTYPNYRTFGFNGLGAFYSVKNGPTFWVHITAPTTVRAC